MVASLDWAAHSPWLRRAMEGFAAGGVAGTALPLGWIAARWVLGAAFFYNAMVCVDGLYNAPLLLALGIEVDAIMDRPWASASLADFWSRRWDKAVQNMLVAVSYRPLRKLGCSRGVAVAGCFVASGLLHLYGIVLGGLFSWVPCLSMLGFFVVQPMLLCVEAARSGRNFFWALIASSPFFMEPFLAVLGL